MRVALTRERGANDEAREWFAGADRVDEVPLTSTVAASDKEFADAVISLGDRRFSVLVVSSARGAPRAAQLAGRCERVLSAGPATSRALRALGVTPSDEAPGAASLARMIARGPVLAVGARESRPELDESLAARGIELVRLAAYETRVRDLSDEEHAVLAASDVVLIGAPSAWHAARPDVDQHAWVVVPGATTAEVVREEHERVLVGWDTGLYRRLRALLEETEGGA